MGGVRRSVADFERRHPDAMAAVADEDLDACDPDDLDDLVSDLRGGAMHREV